VPTAGATRARGRAGDRDPVVARWTHEARPGGPRPEELVVQSPATGTRLISIGFGLSRPEPTGYGRGGGVGAGNTITAAFLLHETVPASAAACAFSCRGCGDGPVTDPELPHPTAAIVAAATPAARAALMVFLFISSPFWWPGEAAIPGALHGLADHAFGFPGAWWVQRDSGVDVTAASERHDAAGRDADHPTVLLV